MNFLFQKHMDYIIDNCKNNDIDYDFIKQSFININESKQEKFI